MKSIITLMFWLVLFSFSAAAEQKVQTDPVTGAKTWGTKVNGVHFSLTQILPEQLKAFYKSNIRIHKMSKNMNKPHFIRKEDR